MANIIEVKGWIYIQYRDAGVRRTVSTKLRATEENYKKAEAMKKEIVKKVEIKKSDIKYRDLIKTVERKNSIKDITIEKAVEKYKHKLALTSYSYRYRFGVAMNHFYKIVPANNKINKVTYEHSLKFVKYLMDRKLSNASVRTYYDHVKVLFLFLVKHKHLHNSPFSTEVLPRKSKKTIIPFEKSMLDDILSAAKETDDNFYCILVLLLLTGLRPIDLLKIKARDINFAEKRIFIKISKTDKEINIPMSKSLTNFILNEMKYITDLDGDQLLFDDYSVNRLGRRFRRLKSRLGIKERYVWTLKTFRKTFGTHYAKSLSIQDVAFLLGHDEVETSKSFYAATIVDNVRNKMDELDERKDVSNSISITLA